MLGLFLDFEATDKDVATARITQVAFSLYDTDTKKEVYHYSSLILPEGEFEIDPVAGAITGITKEQLTKYGIALDEALNVLLRSLVGVDFLAAHNLHNYDLPLLKNEVKRLRQEEVQLPKLIDTRFDVPWPEHIETRKLTYLGAEFGIVNPAAHSARHDVDLMALLFFRFPVESILERARSPMVWVRANVNYDNREKAKAHRFIWLGDKKIWAKQYKEIDLIKHKELFDFTITILPPDFLP